MQLDQMKLLTLRLTQLLLKITIDTKIILMSLPVLPLLIFVITITTGQKDQYMTLKTSCLVVIKSYFHYLYFNTVKWSYFQGMVIVPYLALAPTIVTGAITLGFVQQITRAFGRVEGSLQYLVKSWSTIVEFISVWKRLSEFEKKLSSSDLIYKKI